MTMIVIITSLPTSQHHNITTSQHHKSQHQKLCNYYLQRNILLGGLQKISINWRVMIDGCNNSLQICHATNFYQNLTSKLSLVLFNLYFCAQLKMDVVIFSFQWRLIYKSITLLKMIVTTKIHLGTENMFVSTHYINLRLIQLLNNFVATLVRQGEHQFSGTSRNINYINL